MRLMEPLDIDLEAVEISTLKRWADYSLQYLRCSDYTIPLTDHNAPYTVSPFPCQAEINNKIAIWTGDITVLQVDAIINLTNESMDNANNPLCQRIFPQVGPGFEKNIYNEVEECNVGQVKITQSHNLPARLIIHAEGPLYNAKFHSAAEHGLHCCYRNILQKAQELGLRSLALPVINLVSRNYPSETEVHIVLKTVRQFLDTHTGDIICIVFVLSPTELELYERLFTYYFPRNLSEEANACWHLPNNIEVVNSEQQNVDRQIRIIDNPHHTLQAEESIELTPQLETSINMGDYTFMQMQGDLDRQRLLGERPASEPLTDIMRKEIQHKERYERLLRRAKTEDLSEVSGIGCLYQSGVDRQGRPIVVFLGKWFPATELNLDKALLYLILLLDPIVQGDYVIAYFHTLTVNNNYPSFHWIKEIYNVLPYKYKKNLKQFYIVHPTFWTKMMTWWFLTFTAPALKEKVHNLPGVEYLYEVIAPSQLEVPAYVTEYDMTINGLRYYTPNQYAQSST